MEKNKRVKVEHPLGSTFTFKGKKITVRKTDYRKGFPCHLCVFIKNFDCNKFACIAQERQDETSVYFTEADL